jgi:WhiB family redox-sensing transcriptional regulator
MLAGRPAWYERAACRGKRRDWFFGDDGAALTEGRKVCARCAVRAACLAYALANDERHGTWGGTSERERRRMLRQAS